MKPGVVVWLTGLPASGKSTLARRVAERLQADGRACAVLDGDVMREVLAQPGYDAEARDLFYRRLGALAAELARQGLVVLVPATASRREYRERARALAPRFLEVFVSAAAEECARRDAKGLYAQARRGELPELPGVGAPYDAPERPDLVAGGGHDDDACRAIVDRIG